MRTELSQLQGKTYQELILIVTGLLIYIAAHEECESSVGDEQNFMLPFTTYTHDKGIIIDEMELSNKVEEKANELIDDINVSMEDANPLAIINAANDKVEEQLV